MRAEVLVPSIAALLAAAVTIMATVPNGLASSNIATWLPFLIGVRHADQIAYGTALLLACSLVFWWLLPRRKKMANNDAPENDKPTGPVGIHIEDSSDIRITNSRGSGLSSFIRAVNSTGLKVHNNESNDTHTFMDLDGVKGLEASGNIHNRKAQQQELPGASAPTGPAPKGDDPIMPKATETRRQLWGGWTPPKDGE